MPQPMICLPQLDGSRDAAVARLEAWGHRHAIDARNKTLLTAVETVHELHDLVVVTAGRAGDRLPVEPTEVHQDADHLLDRAKGLINGVSQVLAS